MVDLSTTYMGLQLRNPIIAGSTGLTAKIENLIEIEKQGAGAIVLKSLFEEEIRTQLDKDLGNMQKDSYLYPETMDYYDNYDVEDKLSNYLKLISDAKKQLTIPVIASVNCVTAEKWPYYVQTLQSAGAAAIELNIFTLPSDFNKSPEEQEKLYFDVLKEVKKNATIPVSLKISHYHSNLAGFVKRLSESGPDALVLFNRYYNPDFDINNFEMTSSSVLSSPAELGTSLRWIGILSGATKCQLSATTGIHDGDAVIKQLLAGAQTVQLASTLYKNGFKRIKEVISDLEVWMNKKNFETIDQFRGKMSQKEVNNPAAFERVQFMKYFGEYQEV